jgi:hypothetical protein
MRDLDSTNGQVSLMISLGRDCPYYLTFSFWFSFQSLDLSLEL